MKTKALLTLSILILLSTSLGAQDIPKAPPDKAVVYFMRTSGYGFLINFSYFDSATLVGIFAGQGYLRYECEPGPHLFWARSENKDFVEAQLDSGKIYFLEAVVLTGWGKARVELNPVDPANAKKMKAILKLLKSQPPNSLSETEIKSKNEDFGQVILRGLQKYQEEKAAGTAIKQLSPTMFYGN